MADDIRLGRLEDKVDVIKSEVSELRTDFKIHVTKIEDKMDIFSDHITGDNKIISHLQPVLEQLPELTNIIKEYQFEKELRRRRSEKTKKIASTLGIVSVALGIIISLIKLF